jgi:predicted phosphoadenosine phosphosulfate sulfurtransferase
MKRRDQGIGKMIPMGESVLSMAERRVASCFDRFDVVAVSFSGGKDSTAVLNVALKVARERRRLPLEVFFFDEEAIQPETVDYVRRVSRLPDVKLRWLCLPVEHHNACSDKQPCWHPWAPEDRAKWVRDLPPEGETELEGFCRKGIAQSTHLLLPPSRGQCVMLMGIRAQESLSRYRSVACKRGFDCFMSPVYRIRHLKKAYPIYDWAVEDVWLAPQLLGWDYNRCTPAESPIWMGDFSFRPVAAVREGDQVIGWGPGDSGRDLLVRTPVTAVHRLPPKLVVKVTMASGRTLRCTPDHLWFSRVGTVAVARY